MDVQSSNAQSFAGSMVSSVGSEGSVFDQGEGLLEEHKDQIMETLEILREQRCSEENDVDVVAEQDGECLVLDHCDGPADQKGKCVVLEQNGKCLVPEHIGVVSLENDHQMEYLEEHANQIALEQNGEGVAVVEKHSVVVPGQGDCSGEIKSSVSGDSETTGHDIQMQNGKGFVLGNGPEPIEVRQQQAIYSGEKMYFSSDALNKNDSDPTTPAFEGNEMSRSAEFSDPKTYYHMTFPVLKEDTSPTAQATHSMVESSEVVGHIARSAKEVSSETVLLSPQENGASTVAEKVSQQSALSQSCCSTENVQELSREKNRWRTM